VASFEMTCDGVFGGPCPVCGGSGLLLSHVGEFGGYRTLRHLDAAGREQVCTLPEVEGMVRTAAGRWWYVPADAAVRHLTASMVVFDQRAQNVLLVHHKASGVWMFPGGHVDPGEDPAAAAVREVFEETGVYPMIVGPPPIVLPGMSWLPNPWLTCEIPAPAKPDRGPGKPAEAAHSHVDMLFIGVAEGAEGVARLEVLETAVDEVHAVRWVALDHLDGWAEVRAEVPRVARLAHAWAREWWIVG